MTELFGTDPSLLHRADASDTSIAAARSVDTTSRERAVLEKVSQFNAVAGCISDQVRAAFYRDTPYSSVTARYSALERKGFIARGPDRRAGDSHKLQLVMRMTQRGWDALANTEA